MITCENSEPRKIKVTVEVAVPQRSVVGFPNFSFTFQSVDCIHTGTCHPVTPTIESDVDSVKTNQHAKGQRSFRSKVIGQTHTHINTLDRLLYLDH